MQFKKYLLTIGLLGLIQTGCALRTTRTEEIADSLMDKTVMLETPIIRLLPGPLQASRMGTIKCSGVIISPTGHILTCAHCVKDEGILTVNVFQHNGPVQKAIVLARDHDKDLALLKINAENLPYAVIANQYGIAVGQDVVAVGYPLGFSWSVTKGIISAVHRNDLEPRVDMTQSDTAINPGNSGGPLFSMDEELIGINSCMVPPVNAPIFTGLGFSVSPSQIRAFLDVFRGLWVAVKNN